MRTLSLSLLLLAAACTPDFAAQSDVTDLRVLAVRAEPPEAQYDATSSPPSIDPVRLTILAADPRNTSPMTMTFQLCAPTDSRRCDGGPATAPVARPLGPLDLQVPPEALLEAISAVAAGQRYLDPNLAQKLALDEVEGAGKSAVERLSEREFEVFVRLAGGASVQRIADDLKLSGSTVGTHLYNIKQKLGASNQAELTLIAIRHGLIQA